MKKGLFLLSGISIAGGITSSWLYVKMGNSLALPFAITFGTFAYHFVMRLVVGYAIDGIYHNQMNFQRKWFAPKAFEEKLYEKLKVKKWKDRMPTYEASTFSLKEHTVEEIIQGMCQAEIVHELIAALSFVPLLFSLIWGTFGVFFITSVLAAGLDMMFVMMQRYNRPRLMRLLKHKKGQG